MINGKTYEPLERDGRGCPSIYTKQYHSNRWLFDYKLPVGNCKDTNLNNNKLSSTVLLCFFSFLP